MTKYMLSGLVMTLCGFGMAGAQTHDKKPRLTSMLAQIERTVAQSPELAEVGKLYERVKTLHNEGKFEQAIPLEKEILEARQRYWEQNMKT